MIYTDHLIIGAAAAGIGNAIKLRDLDAHARITCITQEAEVPYNRCLLADYLAGIKQESEIATKGQDFFDQRNITLLRNAKAIAIDAIAHHVQLEDGRVIEYKKLFLGIGRSSTIPSLPGSSTDGVFSFYTLNDVKRIRNFIDQYKVTHAIVAGGGLSGLECADALNAQGINVTLVNRNTHVLSRQLDAAGSTLLAKRAHVQGTAILNNTSITHINSRENRVTDIILTDGSIIPSHMVIFAIGSQPNIELAHTAALEVVGNGVVVTPTMQTSNPDIFAGGDICLIKDLATQQLTQSCLWTDAIMQGMVAAHAMVGQAKSYPGSLIVTSSHIFKTTFVTCGEITNPPAEWETRIAQDAHFYHKFLVFNGQLKAFAMVGNVDNVGLLRKKLLDKSPF